MHCKAASRRRRRREQREGKNGEVVEMMMVGNKKRRGVAVCDCCMGLDRAGIIRPHRPERGGSY